MFARRGIGAVALLGVFTALGSQVSAAPEVRTPREQAAARGGRDDQAAPPRSTRRARSGPSPFDSREACEAVLAARKKGPSRNANRIASWNIRWFPDGAARGPGKHATDLGWLACTIAALDVQVVAVQEFVQHTRGRGALLDLLDLLDARTGGAWQQALDDCPGSGRQHVGFLWNTARVTLSDRGPVAALNPGEHACGKNLRPGYGAHATFKDGTDVHLVVVHLDSGTTARDRDNRVSSLSRLDDVAASLTTSGDPDLLVVGDFNSMGCDDCTPAITAAEDVAALETSAVAADMKRLGDGAFCSAYYGSQPSLLDHVLARGAGLLALDPRVDVHGPCGDLGCRPLRRGEHPPAFERLSDHCPVVIELPARTSK